MKTIICISRVGTLALTLISTGVWANANRRVVAPKAISAKFEATAPAREEIRSQGEAGGQLEGVIGGNQGAIVTGGTATPGVQTGGVGTPTIRFVSPPNVSVHETTTTSANQLSQYLEVLKNLFGPTPGPESTQPSDLNLFGTPTNETYSSMASYPGASSDGPIQGHNCSKRDTDRLTCMACNIYFEARGESHIGQVEVGRTVMARLFSRAYARAPDTTTCDIVYAHRQYSWTEDDISNQLPGSANSPNPRVEAAIAAAREALEKGPGLYTNYYALQGMTTGRPPSWAGEGTCAQTRNQLGNHTFCNIQGIMNRPQAEILAAEGTANGIPVRTLASESPTTGQ